MGKTTRRQVGTGGLSRRADGMWIGTVSLGKDGSGKRIRRYVSSRSQKVAQDELNKLLRQADANGGMLPSTTLTVNAWLDQWMRDIVAPHRKPGTTANYRRTLDLYVRPHLGRLKLSKLAPFHVRSMLDELGKPREDGSRLSQSTIHRAHRVLRKALEDALREGLVMRNVAKLVDPPSLPVSSRGALSVDEAKALLKASADDPMGPRWAVALLLGVRQGEALGLEWDRVDLEAGTARLEWALQRVPWRHGCGDTPSCDRKRAGSCPDRVLDVPVHMECRQLDGALCLLRPKTKGSWRVVPLPDLVLALLRALHGQGNGRGLVFTREMGRPIDPSDDNAAWHEALKRAALPSVPLHCARHTTASLLASLRVPAEVIVQIMGHSSYAVTQGYVHRDLTLPRAAMEQLNAAFTD